MNWDGLDYLVAILLLCSCAGAYIAVRRIISGSTARFFAGIAVLLAGAFIWVQLAVGVF